MIFFNILPASIFLKNGNETIHIPKNDKRYVLFSRLLNRDDLNEDDFRSIFENKFLFDNTVLNLKFIDNDFFFVMEENPDFKLPLTIFNYFDDSFNNFIKVLKAYANLYNIELMDNKNIFKNIIELNRSVKKPPCITEPLDEPSLPIVYYKKSCDIVSLSKKTNALDIKNNLLFSPEYIEKQFILAPYKYSKDNVSILKKILSQLSNNNQKAQTYELYESILLLMSHINLTHFNLLFIYTMLETKVVIEITTKQVFEYTQQITDNLKYIVKIDLTHVKKIKEDVYLSNNKINKMMGEYKELYIQNPNQLISFFIYNQGIHVLYSVYLYSKINKIPLINCVNEFSKMPFMAKENRYEFTKKNTMSYR